MLPKKLIDFHGDEAKTNFLGEKIFYFASSHENQSKFMVEHTGQNFDVLRDFEQIHYYAKYYVIGTCMFCANP